MHRRDFLKGSAAAVAASSSAHSLSAATSQADGFKLKYAPHEGMFRHHAGDDLFDQPRFMRDEGFHAFEDNWASRRPADVQEKIGKTLDELGMTMGVFVAHGEFGGPSFNSSDPSKIERIKKDMQDAVEAAERLGAKWCTVVPGGYDQGLERDYQMALAVDNLRRCAEILEPSGLTIVLESLNPWRDHPGLFLTKVPQAYLLCRAVGSPSVKILDDLYHQQITEGNLIPNMDRAWDEIGYFQVGDNPGRNEPGTGEINYNRVFHHIHQRGFQGVIGMEHGNSMGGKEGERAVIDAYKRADDF